MKKSFYITTTLPYVNAEPHIGFAFEILTADVISRYHRNLLGEEVFFNTGTDEHGTKILKKATEEGRDVKEYVDEFAEKFKSLKEKLNLDSQINFVRTTDEKHILAAQEMWKRSFAKGDIEKRKYKGLYCVGDEAFVKETDLVEGKCPNHPNMDLQEIEEENYFFKLSNYKDTIKKQLENPNSVLPDWRREEAIKIVDGMEDFSISREKSRLPWGIAVPGDETQVMYVWFDALTSYISTLGWSGENDGDFKKFWVDGETLQLAGKDQVKFQSVIWQAMLLSADLPSTKTVLYHGFINSGGQKMSKSLGNVIAPGELIEKYGVDSTRYLLLRHVHPFEDTDVTWERLDELYTAHLVNGLGNLVSRVMKLAEDNIDPVTEANFSYKLDGYLHEKLDEFRTDLALNYIWEKIGELDKEIQEKKPWESKDKEVLSNLAKRVGQIGHMLAPFLPETSEKIIDSVRNNKKPETSLFPRNK
jgi:methionyl-tRNA synthetase